jgi:hypothetical protein
MPAIQEVTNDLILYMFLRDSFNAKLEEYHLSYSYELPLSTVVSDLIQRVVNDMQRSPFAYQFSADGRGSFLPHETLPLQLLELVNRGLVRQSGGPVRLRRAPPRANQTLFDLATDRYRFAAAHFNVEGNQLAINFGK